MEKFHKKSFPDKYGALFLGLVLLIVSLFAKGQTYNPTNFTTTNKSYGVAQAVSTDARSWFYDATNFVMRDYQSTAEVNGYLNIPKYRAGHFPIFVHNGGFLQSNGVWLGGTTQVYWYKDSTGNANLVRWYTDSIPAGAAFQIANNLSEGIPATMRTNLGLGAMSLLGTTAGGDLSGTFPNPTVAKFNGQLPAYYLNYLNLNNLPSIPAQINITDAGLFTHSGTYPNLTFLVTTPGVQATITANNALSGDATINTGAFNFILSGTSAFGFPAGNTAQRPGSPSAGWTRFNTDSLANETFNGSIWVKSGTGSGGGGGGITALTGDGTASGTGSVPFTLTTVNSNVFGSNTFLKFGVNGKGLVTSATAVLNSDIVSALGFTPYNATNPAGYISGIGNQGGSGDTLEIGNNIKRLIPGYGMNANVTNSNSLTYSPDTTKIIPYTDTSKVNGVATQTYVNGQGFLKTVPNLTATQNATNYNLAIAGANNQNLLIATHALAGLMDTASKAVTDSLKNRTYTWPVTNIYALNGMQALGVDSFGLGGNPLYQSTTINTAGFPLLITNLPNKTVGGTDSALIEDATGKVFKALFPSGGGAVASVSDNGSGSLTVSPTTGAVLAGINLAHSNTWTAAQTVNAAFATNNSVNLTGTLYTAGGVKYDVLVQDTTNGLVARQPYYPFDTTGFASGSTFVKLNGSGNKLILGTASGGGTPGGSNTQVQFNNSGAFGGSANLTWNGTTLGTTGFSASGSVALSGVPTATGSPSILMHSGQSDSTVKELTIGSGLTVSGGSLTATGTPGSGTRFFNAGYDSSGTFKAGRGARVYDVVVDFGADTTGTIDATPAIQAAINACFLGGGGTVYFRNGHYKIAGAFNAANGNCQIYFPSVNPFSNPRNTVISLVGEGIGSIPGGGYGPTVSALPTTGVILHSTISGTGTTPSIFGAVPNGGGFNYTDIYMENMNIQAWTNHATHPATVSGLNFSKVSKVSLYKVTVGLDTTNQASLDPDTANVAGMMLSNFQNGGPNTIRECQVSGFRYGMCLAEHTLLENDQIFACDYAITGGLITYAVGGQVLWHACKHGLYAPTTQVMGLYNSGFMLVDLRVEIEHDIKGFWYDFVNDVVDSSTHLRGDLRYSCNDSTGQATLLYYGGSLIRYTNLYALPGPGVAPGATGAIPFRSNFNAGVLTAMPSNLFMMDSTNGRVLVAGGGASGGAPQQLLHIRSAGTTGGNFEIENTNSAAVSGLLVNNSSAELFEFVNGGSTNGSYPHTGVIYGSGTNGIFIQPNGGGGISFFTSALAKHMLFTAGGNLDIGNIGGVIIPDVASSKFTVGSTTQGTIPCPKMNTTNQNAISSPVSGLTIWNTDSLDFVTYTGTAWLKERGAGGGGGSGTVTSVATGLGLSGGPITTTGTIIADTSYLMTKNTTQVTTGNKTFGGLINFSVAPVFNALPSAFGTPKIMMHNGDSTGGQLSVGAGLAIISGALTATAGIVPPGAAGDIPFQNTFTGTWSTLPSSLFHMDSTNQRLGIGTASPSFTLDVRGSNPTTTGIQVVNTNAATNATAFINIKSNGTSVLQLGTLSTVYTTSGLFTANSSYLYQNTGALNLMTNSQAINLSTNSGSAASISLSGANALSLGFSGTKLSGVTIFSTGAIQYNGGAYNSSLGSQFQIAGATVNNPVTGASGTVTNYASNDFEAATITSTNTGVTYTNASTLYVGGPPIASTNSTITNPYAFNVNSGTSLFGGQVLISGNSNWSPGTVASSRFSVAPITLTDNTTGASGTAANAYVMGVSTPTLAATNTGVTTTNAYTFYINAAPFAGTNETITNTYALGVGGPSVFLADMFLAHSIYRSSTPGIAAGTGAGTSPTVSVSGTDVNGDVTITTGTAPSGSAVVATITFASAYSYPNHSYPTLTPGNAATALLSGGTMVYTVGSTSTWTINAGTSGLTSATTYLWHFRVDGN